MLNNYQNKKLKEDGILKIENFLSKEEIHNLKKIIHYYSASKSSKNSYWPTNNYLLMLKLLKLDFRRFKHSLKILKFEKEKNLKQYAQVALDSKKVFLNYIDAYVSKKSKQNIIPWHTDQAYHGDLSQKIL